MSACLFGVGANIAHERSLGWLEMKRVSPAGSAVYLFGKITANLVFCVVIQLLLLILGLPLWARDTHSHSSFGDCHGSRSWRDSICGVRCGIGILDPGEFGACRFEYDQSADGFLFRAMDPHHVPAAFFAESRRILAHLSPEQKLALDVIGLDSAPAIALHWEALASFGVIFVGLAAWAYNRQGSPAEVR